MSLDHDKLKKRRAGSRTGSGWRPREGSNKVRILPPKAAFINNWDSMEDLSISYKIHFFRIEGRPTEVSRCLEELKQRCPACDAWRAWRKTEDPGLKEMAKQIAPADQYLFNVLDMANLSTGIQSYAANYTVWDKIMEVAANPAWGNVVDPANGVDFEINMTPGARSRTGFNQYSVTPSPQRTNVMPVLQGIPDWATVLDSLVDQISAPKEADEIAGLIEEMGFPPPTGGTGAKRTPVTPAGGPTAIPRAVQAAGPVAVAVGAPAAGVASPGPVAVRVPSPVAVTIPGASAPAAAMPVETDRSAPIQRGGGHAGVPAAVHYDPGEQYKNPRLQPADIPAGAPRCFSDYKPTVHRCQPCPVVADCQLKMLGI